MKTQKNHLLFAIQSVTVVLLVFLWGTSDSIFSQTPAEPPASTSPQSKTAPSGTTPGGQTQSQKSTPSSAGVDQRLQALNRDLEETQKKIEEFSKLVAQERSRLPSESVLLDQYLFLQSQVQELGTKVDQLQRRPRPIPAATGTPSPPAPESHLFSLSSLLLPILIVVLYDRLFNTRRLTPLEERVGHLEDYAYGKEIHHDDPFKEGPKDDEA